MTGGYEVSWCRRCTRSTCSDVAIQVSGSFGSRQEEAQRLGRLLRPKESAATSNFYTLVARDTVDQDFAQNRQRFLAEQGYSYTILKLAHARFDPALA